MMSGFGGFLLFSGPEKQSGTTTWQRPKPVKLTKFISPSPYAPGTRLGAAPRVWDAFRDSFVVGLRRAKTDDFHSPKIEPSTTRIPANNFFAIASILYIFDVLKISVSLLFTFRTFCAITADGSRLWDSNRLTKIEKSKNSTR